MRDEELRPIGLDELAEGAAGERWAHEFERLLDNILDPNRDPEAKRTIVLKVEVVPEEDRRSAKIGITVDSKLAPLSRVSQQIHLGRMAGTGQPVAVRFDPGQHDIFRAKGAADVLPITKATEARSE